MPGEQGPQNELTPYELTDTEAVSIWPTWIYTYVIAVSLIFLWESWLWEPLSL